MENQKFETWAIVELFGHQKIAGKCSEATIGGGAFLRIDVPAANSEPAFTRYLGNGAIYAINPVTEEIARAAANSYKQTPVQPYDVPLLRQKKLLGYPPDDRNDDEFYSDEDKF